MPLAVKKRRRLLLVTFIGVALLAVFALVGLKVHWRLYGWWRGEPFCDGLPTSYYAARIRASWVIRPDLGGAVRVRPYTVPEMWLRRHHARAIADALWPPIIVSNDSPHPFEPDTPDAAKLPVLLALLDDSDMRVRWWASEKLARVNGESASTAAAALERLLRHEDPSARFIAVLALGQLGPPARSALPTLLALRGDTTRVEWMGNQFDELVDLAIRSIAPDALPPGADRPDAAPR